MKSIYSLISLILFASALQAQILSEGLVVYYPFNGNTSDESGNGNDGELFGSSFTIDRFNNQGSALLMDGIDDYVQIPTIQISQLTEGSISCWIYVKDLSEDNCIFQIGNTSSTNSKSSIVIRPDGAISFHFRKNSSPPQYWYESEPGVITENEWYHLVIIQDEISGMNMFIDGGETNLSYSPDGSPTGTEFFEDFTISPNIATFGAKKTHNYNDAFLNGIIDDIRFYDKTLTSLEVIELYNEEVAGPATETGTVSDASGTIYKTVKIGNQWWMAENLAYLPTVTASFSSSFTDPMYYVYNYAGNDVSEAKNSQNYLKYGVLYNWPAALEVCPDGWHLPSDDEWKTLEEFLGMDPGELDNTGFRGPGVGYVIKSEQGWNGDGDGSNSSGFNALPAGHFHDAHGFEEMGNQTDFWTATENATNHAWRRRLIYNENQVARNRFSYKKDGRSVRCIKNELSGIKITKQPESAVSAAKGNVSFKIECSGSHLEYQWQKDNLDLSNTERINGVNSSKLSINQITVDDAGDYRCIASNSEDSVISNIATLTISSSTGIISGNLVYSNENYPSEFNISLFNDQGEKISEQTAIDEYSFEVADGSYSLKVEASGWVTMKSTLITIDSESVMEDIDFVLTTIPDPFENPRTLIITDHDRINDLYEGEDNWPDNGDNVLDTDQLKAYLNNLAGRDEVKGNILSVNDHNIRFAENNENASWLVYSDANAVSNQIHHLIQSQESDNLKYILIVGNDEIIPFHRVDDPSSHLPRPVGSQYHEEDYVSSDISQLRALNNPVANSYSKGYLFTDNFYGDLDKNYPFIPDYAISRLVETPTDLLNQIDAYLKRDTHILSLSRSRCGSAIFGEGSAAKNIHEEISLRIGDAEYLLKKDWTETKAKEIINTDIDGFLFYSGHGSHVGYSFNDGSNLYSSDVDYLGQSIIIGATCHGGLNIPDVNFSGESENFFEDDMASTYMNAVAAGYLSFTGFGGGTRHFLTHTDKILALFSEYLTRGFSIGESLTQAKRTYYNGKFNHTLKQEKSLLILTEYGLPFYKINDSNVKKSSPINTKVNSYDVTEQEEKENGTVLTVEYEIPKYDWIVVDNKMAYLNHKNMNLLEPFKPTLPTSSFHFPEVNGSILRGVELINSSFEYIDITDPYFTLGDIVYFEEPEVEDFYSKDWYPNQLYTLNKLDAIDSTELNLLIAGAQLNTDKSQIRIAKSLTFKLYYSSHTNPDKTAPTIQNENLTLEGDLLSFQVSIQDESLVNRASLLLSTDNGLSWESIEMLSYGDYYIANVQKPKVESVHYFFLAKDEWGNIGTLNNSLSGFSYTLEGEVAPKIDVLSFDYHHEGNNIPLEIVVTDKDFDLNLESVYIYYRINAQGEWNKEPMESTGQVDHFGVHVGNENIETGDTIFFYFSASDQKGNIAMNPASNSELNAYKTVLLSTTSIGDYGLMASKDDVLAKIFPNPSTGKFTIETDCLGHHMVEIASINGQSLLTIEMEGTGHQIDLSSYDSGIYFITIRSKDFVTTRKVVKL